MSVTRCILPHNNWQRSCRNAVREYGKGGRQARPSVFSSGIGFWFKSKKSDDLLLKHDPRQLDTKQMATDLSQEAAMRKLRSTPVVRSKEPMPAETRMEIIELVQTNVDKVSTIIAVFLSSLHTILAPVSSNRDPLRLTSFFFL